MGTPSNQRPIHPADGPRVYTTPPNEPKQSIHAVTEQGIADAVEQVGAAIYHKPDTTGGGR